MLEIGSGGYNAALIAEVVGEESEVVGIDIDSEIGERAGALLAGAGYGGRVSVMIADASRPLGLGLFDRIIVTAGAWDIPPARLAQLAPDGVLVVPLRMNKAGQCIKLHVEDGAPDDPDRLSSALAYEPADVWSSAESPHRASFADMCLGSPDSWTASATSSAARTESPAATPSRT